MAGIEYNRPERDARTRDARTRDARTRDARTRDQDPGRSGPPAVGQGSLPVCPSCGRSEEVRAVQAVFLDGHRHVRDESGVGSERQTTTREVVSRLARDLAPVPPKPSARGWGCLGVLLVMGSIPPFVIAVVTGQWLSDEPDLSAPTGPGSSDSFGPPDLGFLAWISAGMLLVAVGLFVWAARSLRAYRAKTEPGREAAERLWRQGWHCARCGTVHFSGGRALNLQEFRTQVWTAGGYGELAARHPAGGGSTRG
ncbi:hypothetical protein OG389_04430 [Streptomyces sp. NBC_00435]|uniref:hypothetical protein n=1 Tax=Streptomyces sp. NBC_00435 TaxID=2903649 RepID=UPI002E23CE69